MAIALWQRMKRSKRKYLLYGVIFLFALWLLSTMFGAKPPQYVTEPVKRGDVEISILATGILKPYQLVAAGARVTGRVIGLHVRAGSEVKAGDLLAEIDPTNQQNRLLRAEAELAVKEARLIQERANLDLIVKKMQRVRKLLASRSVAQEDYDTIFTKWEIQKATVAALEAEKRQSQVDISIARNDLDYTKIVAPIDGTVLATMVEKGQIINAAQSAPTVVIIGDLRKMKIYAKISEADISRAHIGQKVYFNLLGAADKRYEAILENIEPAPESIRGDIKVNPSASSSFVGGAIYYNTTFIVDNPDQALHTYMTAQVHILLDRAQNVLTIPSIALRNVKGDKAEVIVLKDGQIEKRTITIGLNDRAVVEVKKGLTLGERVVTGIRSATGAQESLDDA